MFPEKKNATTEVAARKTQTPMLLHNLNLRYYHNHSVAFAFLPNSVIAYLQNIINTFNKKTKNILLSGFSPSS